MRYVSRFSYVPQIQYHLELSIIFLSRFSRSRLWWFQFRSCVLCVDYSYMSSEMSCLRWRVPWKEGNICCKQFNEFYRCRGFRNMPFRTHDCRRWKEISDVCVIRRRSDSVDESQWVQFVSPLSIHLHIFALYVVLWDDIMPNCHSTAVGNTEKKYVLFSARFNLCRHNTETDSYDGGNI